LSNYFDLLFHHTVAQSFSFYQHQTSSRNSDGVTPCGGAKYRWGIKISRFSTNKSLYLANDASYRHSYYRRRIEMQAFVWHQFQLPRLTFNPDFKVTILFNVKKTRKWYKISLYLQWPTNRKSHMVYQTAPFSMTLNDP